MVKKIPEKLKEWRKFSELVESHIVNYVIPQYGDYPDEFSLQSVKEQLLRYVGRINRSSRGPKEELRDSLKIAHYACFLRRKLFESYLESPNIDLSLEEIKRYDNEAE